MVILLFTCSSPQTHDAELSRTKLMVDSSKDAIFNCYINGGLWNKNDSVSATFYKKSSLLFYSLSSRYNSVTFENINLTAPIEKATNNLNKQILKLQNDTIISIITYSFAEIDYHSESLMPNNHLAFNLKPGALVCFTKIDTFKSTISGTFKGFAIDERNIKYGFKNGVFFNVPFKVLSNQ